VSCSPPSEGRSATFWQRHHADKESAITARGATNSWVEDGTHRAREYRECLTCSPCVHASAAVMLAPLSPVADIRSRTPFAVATGRDLPPAAAEPSCPVLTAA